MWQRTTESYTDWNDRNNAEIWRKSWAESCNQYLAPENKIDHRSYERQGVEQI
ncbi:MobA/MobL family protein, partial [Lactiplantibacillus plantarum]